MRGDTVEISELAPSGLVQLQQTKLPAEAVALEWVGHEPVVMLAKQRSGDPMPLTNHAFSQEAFGTDPMDGVVGRITAKGFEPYPRPPDSTWAKLRAGKHEGKPTSRWSMHVAADTSVWLGHCLFEVTPDMSESFGCDAWAYVRLDAKAPLTTNPPDSPDRLDRRKIVAASSITVSLVRDPDPDKEADRLSCKSSTGNLVYPPPGEPFALGMGEIHWYANDPPVYSSQNQFPGYVTHGPEIVFQGCAVAKELEDPELEVGRNELSVLYTADKLLVIWRDRVVASAAGAHVVRFGPGRTP